jgi:hypothetical protein
VLPAPGSRLPAPGSRLPAPGCRSTSALGGFDNSIAHALGAGDVLEVGAGAGRVGQWVPEHLRPALANLCNWDDAALVALHNLGALSRAACR